MKTGDKDLFTIIYTENQQQFLNSKVLFKKDPYLIFFFLSQFKHPLLTSQAILKHYSP